MNAKNRKEYAGFYDQVNWIDEDAVKAYEKEREQLLSALDKHVQWGFHESKADVSEISPGCRHCGEGEWSCLFINNVCNAKCFYCPSAQDEESVPTTSSLTFENPDEYIAYLKKFGYKGVSISGGEPLLTLDKTLSFIRKVRQELGKDIYIWMYTNGILAEEEKFIALRDAGLNEVRFDISATGYSLSNLKKAVGIIENITVEIPAIPEDYDRMKTLMVEMKQAGVNYLSLHQIRLTDFNFPKLKKRNYTMLHGPKATVLESELTALKLLLYSKEQNIGLPVNYCSYIYRYRFQSRAARIKQTRLFTEPWEPITETGLLRHIVMHAERDVLEQVMGRPEHHGKWKDLGQSLVIHPELLSELPEEEYALSLRYFATKLRNSLTYHFPFKTIPLSGIKSVYIEKGRVSDDIPITKEDIPALTTLFFDNEKPLKWEEIEAGNPELLEDRETRDWLVKIYNFEKLDFGLYPYY